MLVKWFSCEVHDSVGFDLGQRAWGGMHAGRIGLLGQIGGWSRTRENRAHILACWTDQQRYDEFMAGAHDELAAAQRGTYGDVQTDLFYHVLDIASPLPTQLTAAGAVRLAHCFVRAERTEHFVDVQQRVWNPGMESVPGMLGGGFSRSSPTEFLVLTLWHTLADHQRYVERVFPDLRVRSGAADDLASITGDVIEVVPDWTFRTAEPLNR
ncbi:DUF4937 domain-containing protein [Phytoactinopolyspora halotolerans]|uniref:DUF4937 domain-containing protein n=1 Tax=Phytoactinopolyspora halotolerans TaxID=1981512 RepID=A0A6L9SDG3_9ACTN|nr:DUF4937 domain-containing protein [Phytoactinopolyspora halotolerans]NEE03119.1 DUF4937 domain-containing protein [Phytoactinopolyspora halotolerans]